MFRSDEEKVRRLLESIAQETGKRRLKLLQRLEKIGSEEPALLREAAQVLFSCVTDPDPEVWTETERILKGVIEERAVDLKGAMGALVPHIRLSGPARKRALHILVMLASKRRSLVEDFKPILMREVTTKDLEERALMIEVLSALGVNAKEYVKRLTGIEKVLSEAENSGADTTEARGLLEEAKGVVISRGIDEFFMRAKKAELKARYAKKVSIKWRDHLKRVGKVAISSNGRYIAVSTGMEVLMYNRDKEIQWRFSVEGMVSAIRFSPDNSSILIGTMDRMVYRVDPDGNIIWKRRRGGSITDIAITDLDHDIFICSDDSNISVLSMEGVETSRQWTEKAPRRLGVTADGRTLILTFGDHNILCYDKRLFQRWKYMGGIWNDVDISRKGNYIMGGSHGGDVVCLSNSGLPVWKRNLATLVRAVQARAEAGAFLVGTKDGLRSFDATGREGWFFQTKDDLICFDVSQDGGTIVVGTVGGILLLENREFFKRFIEELGPSLRTMGVFGIDVSGLDELIRQAKASFDSNDYKKGAMFAGTIMQRMEEAKLERGSELLVLAEKKLADAKESGVDVSEGVGVLHRAEELINRGDFDGAILEARHAVDLARRAESAKRRTEKAETEKRRSETRKVIEVAVSMIDEAESLGIDTTEAENLLQAAITAADEAEFDQCIVIVKDLDEELNKGKRTIPGKTEANFARAFDILEREASSPHDLAGAVEDINRAVKYYEAVRNMIRVAECYDLLAKLEARLGNPIMSKANYQKAINTYFRAGELERVAKIIMEMMRDLKGDEEMPVYEIEDAFLIYWDGRLIAHHTVRLRPEMDRQILGGMLVAIQNFVEDSLMASGTEMLNELRYGNTKIIIQRGRYITMALVITGTESKELWSRVRKAIDEIEEKYDKILERWDGDLDKLWGVKKVFEQYISQL